MVRTGIWDMISSTQVWRPRIRMATAERSPYGVPRTLSPAKAANEGRRRPSRYELADNLAADVSKPEVAALEAVGQLGVVESKQV